LCIRMKLFRLPLLTNLILPRGFLWRLAVCLGVLLYQPLFAAEGQGPQSVQVTPQSSPPQKTRTIVADLLMIDGPFYVVRDERGEIRIEVTPETQLSETFKFGDRIKAILLPNDEALSISRAQPGEPIGTTSGASTFSSPSPGPSSSPSPETAQTAPPQPGPSFPKGSNVRIIIADLLMVDGNLYIIRSEHGEIQIEVTPQTELSETFKFGDRIKARVTPQDQALSIVRANPGESPGIRLEEAPLPSSTPTAPPVAIPPPSETAPPKKDMPATAPPKESSKIRTVVAEVLMIDGDFYILRGERGEIRIEVTPKTTLSESFKFGDKIKARILPNDTALSIERAKPDEPFGVHTPP
jgi:exosome complex RNA-binding protein Csl4